MQSVSVWYLQGSMQGNAKIVSSGVFCCEFIICCVYLVLIIKLNESHPHFSFPQFDSSLFFRSFCWRICSNFPYGDHIVRLGVLGIVCIGLDLKTERT